MSIQGTLGARLTNPGIEKLRADMQALNIKRKEIQDNIYKGQDPNQKWSVDSTPAGIGNEDSRKLWELMDRLRPSTDKLQSAAYQTYFDGNKDGTVSKDELTQSLQTLQDKVDGGNAIYLSPPSDILGKPAVSPDTPVADDSKNTALADMKQAITFGQQLLSQFDKISNLDGKNDGISRSDLMLLASKYGGANDSRISDLDFQSLEYSA